MNRWIVCIVSGVLLLTVGCRRSPSPNTTTTIPNPTTTATSASESDRTRAIGSITTDPSSKPSAPASSTAPSVVPPDPASAPDFTSDDLPASAVIERLNADPNADPTLEDAILQSLPDYRHCAADGPETAIRYFHNYIDLNGDGNNEAIAYLVGSYTCGTGGCTTLIFKPTTSGYQLVSQLSVVNTPILVSDQTTQGWRDLIIPVAGSGAAPADHILRFNHQTYPTNPSIAPVLSPNMPRSGTAIIADTISVETPAPELESSGCP
jgi:hypothetical protein